jgi:predicted N-acyltransferase
LARNRQNKIIAGTLNFRSSTHFYGRYWGALEFVKNLHFNICYYEAIDYCIRNKLDYLEPGAGGGEYKFLRGFDPFLVYSVHYFTNPTMKAAVSDFLKQERPLNEVLLYAKSIPRLRILIATTYNIRKVLNTC